MDKKFSSDPNTIKKRSEQLDQEGILVIPVAFGEEINPTDLVDPTTDPKNVIPAKKDEKPGDILDKIMKKIASRKSLALCVFFFIIAR